MCSKFLLENLKGRHHFRDLGVDWRMILKCVFHKSDAFLQYLSCHLLLKGCVLHRVDCMLYFPWQPLFAVEKNFVHNRQHIFHISCVKLHEIEETVGALFNFYAEL